MTKICTVCKKEQPLEEFGKSGLIGKRKARCKSCDRAYQKKYKAKKTL